MRLLPSRAHQARRNVPGTANRKAWDASNGRRLDLIEKKFRDGLTEAEAAELAELKRGCAEHMRASCPRDTSKIDEQIARLDAILRRRKGLV